MPKAPSGNEDRAKVKLRIIEFELEGGNASVESSIRQIVHSLGAKANGAGPRALPGKATQEIAAADGTDAEEIHEAEFTDADDAAPEAPASKTGNKRPSSKPRMPSYLHEMDVTGNSVTFKEFATQKHPQKDTQRHLVAAFWLKEHGNSPTINIDKVYSCYRTAGWPTSQPDWDMNFRSQMKNDRFRRVTQGEYAITPIGEDVVRKLDGTA